jgi:hypothetical protein
MQTIALCVLLLLRVLRSSAMGVIPFVPSDELRAQLEAFKAGEVSCLRFQLGANVKINLHFAIDRDLLRNLTTQPVASPALAQCRRLRSGGTASMGHGWLVHVVPLIAAQSVNVRGRGLRVIECAPALPCSERRLRNLR